MLHEIYTYAEEKTLARKKISTGGKGKGFGSVRKLPSGNYQATYTFNYQKVNAPNTFKTAADARYWLLQEEVSTKNGTWVNPSKRVANASNYEFNAYVENYMDKKLTRNAKPIESSTKDLYRRLLKNQLKGFAGKDIRGISEQDVEVWHSALVRSGKRTTTANAYKLLRAVMNMAIKEQARKDNPCRIVGAQTSSTGRIEYTPTFSEVHQVANLLSPEFKLLTLLGAYGVMRFGELAGLQKGDFRKIPGKAGESEYYEVHIQRQIKYYNRNFEVGAPKSKAGIRTTTLHPDLNPLIEAHLKTLKNRSSFLFTDSNGGYLRNDMYQRQMKAAVESIGLGGRGWHVHSLRHAGATAYANTGANVAEVQRVLGDSSPTAALRYINATNRSVSLAHALPGL
jgi:integrase